jgi:hypothetical protein
MKSRPYSSTHVETMKRKNRKKTLQFDLKQEHGHDVSKITKEGAAKELPVDNLRKEFNNLKEIVGELQKSLKLYILRWDPVSMLR